MTIQDNTDSISLSSEPDVEMDDFDDILSNSRTGILFFPDHEKDSGKRTEARLRAAFASSPTATISNMLNYAANHGLPFRVMIPRPPSTNNGLISLSVMSHDSVESWRAAVVALLQRPHTRAFVSSGGLESLIARWIGGQDLLQRVMQGPILTGPHVKFSHIDGQVYYDDTTTEAERKILFGVMQPQGSRTLMRSLWPTSDILSVLPGYESGTEAWGIRCGLIFHAIQDEISCGKGQYRTRREWHRFLRHGGFANEDDGEGEVWLQRHDAFVNASHDDWHCISLSDLGVSYGEFAHGSN